MTFNTTYLRRAAKYQIHLSDYTGCGKITDIPKRFQSTVPGKGRVT